MANNFRHLNHNSSHSKTFQFVATKETNQGTYSILTTGILRNEGPGRLILGYYLGAFYYAKPTTHFPIKPGQPIGKARHLLFPN